MGRPLNKKYFANTNATHEGVGGEGVASVTVGGTNNSTGYTTGDAATFTAPQIKGGATATGTIVATAGAITSITVTNTGSGYTSVPTVTAATGTLGTTTLTAVLTANGSARQNGIICQAITAGTTNRTSGNDIIKQLGSHRYKVQTQDGTAICTLKSSAPTAAGQMAIVATDSVGGTYYVTKLTARKATVTQGTGVAFATGTQVKWTLGAAVLSDSVSIPNV